MLLAALEPRPPFDVLVVSALSRIGRDTVRTPAAVLQIEEAGVAIWSYLSDAKISLADEMGEAMTLLSSLASSWERRRARQRVYDALRRRVEAGAVHGGKVFGYRNERNGGYVYRVIQQDEARVVRRIFELAAQGYGGKRIALILNAEGVKPPRARGWAPSAIRAMLHNPLYRGEIVWNRTQKTVRRGTKGSRRRDESEWLRRPALDLAIIDEALWQAVDERLRARALRFPLARTCKTGGNVLAITYSEYLLTGFGRCAECGGALGTITRSHGAPPNRFLVRFYGCTTAVNRGPTICGNRTRVRHNILDAAFLDAIRASLDDGIIEEAVARAGALRRERRSKAVERRRGLEREFQEVDQRIDRLVDAIAAAGPVEELLERLRTERARKFALLDELRSHKGNGKDQGEAEVVARLTAHVTELRSLLGQHIPQTRRLLSTMLAEPAVMIPVVEDGRRGYRFSGRLRLGGLLTGEGLDGTRQEVVAPGGFEPPFRP